VSGRKRQRLVDTHGFVLKVVGSAAEVQDRDGARLVAHDWWGTTGGARLVAQALRLYGPALPRRGLVGADAGYSGQLVDDLRAQMGWTLEVVKRPDTQPPSTFAVQPHRWVSERTFSWWGGLRRLSKDYEYPGESSEALIYVGMRHLMLRRLTRTRAGSSPAG
jgi:putative transposase